MPARDNKTVLGPFDRFESLLLIVLVVAALVVDRVFGWIATLAVVIVVCMPVMFFVVRWRSRTR